MKYTQDELIFLRELMSKKPQHIRLMKLREGFSLYPIFWARILYGQLGILTIAILARGVVLVSNPVINKLIFSILYLIVAGVVGFLTFLFSIDIGEECDDIAIVYTQANKGTRKQVDKLKKHVHVLLDLQSPAYCNKLSSYDYNEIIETFRHYFFNGLPLAPKELDSLTDYTQINFELRRKYGIMNQSDLDKILQRGKATKLSPFPEVNSICAKLIELPDVLLSEQEEPESAKYLNI